MMSVSIKPDMKTVAAAAYLLRDVQNGLPRAIKAASRRTLDTSRSRTVKAVGKDLNVRQRDIYRPGDPRSPVRVNLRDAGGLMKVAGRRIPLGRFAARWGGRDTPGATYQISRSGGRKTFAHSFIPQLKTNYRGIFVRRGRDRLPLKEAFGPSVPQVAENQPEVQSLLDHEAAEIFEKNLSSQVDRLLQRSRARG